MLIDCAGTVFDNIGYTRLINQEPYAIIDIVYSYYDLCYYRLYKPIYIALQDQNLYYMYDNFYGIKIYTNGHNQLFIDTILYDYGYHFLYSILAHIEYNIYRPIVERKFVEINNISNKCNQQQEYISQLQNDNKILKAKINNDEVIKSGLEYALLHTKDNLIDCMEEIDH